MRAMLKQFTWNYINFSKENINFDDEVSRDALKMLILLCTHQSFQLIIKLQPRVKQTTTREKTFRDLTNLLLLLVYNWKKNEKKKLL